MLVKNSMIFAATMVLKGALSFALIAAFTRLLSADAYGDYAIIIALVNIADVLGFMWIRHTLMRHITDEAKETDKSYFANAMAIYLVIGASMCAISSLLRLLGIIDAAAQGLLYGLLALIIVTEAFSNLAILMARLRLKLLGFISLSLMKPILSLGIGVFLITSGYGVSGAVWALLISCLIASIWGGATIKDFHRLKPSCVDKTTIKTILVYGLPLIAALSIQSTIKVTDRLLLEGMIGGEITGLYAAAQDIPYKLLTILVSAIHLAGYPLAVKLLQNEGHDACKQQLKINAVLLAAILFPAATAIAILAPQLSHIFLGTEFRPFANHYFAIFAITASLSCIIQYYFILAFHFANKTSAMIIPFLVALAINAATGFFLIPTLAEKGAIIGSLLAYAALLLASIIIGRRLFPMPLPMRDLLKVIIGTAIMGIALYYMNFGLGLLPLIAYIMFGGGIYAATMLLLNPMNLRGYMRGLVK